MKAQTSLCRICRMSDTVEDCGRIRRDCGKGTPWETLSAVGAISHACSTSNIGPRSISQLECWETSLPARPSRPQKVVKRRLSGLSTSRIGRQNSQILPILWQRTISDGCGANSGSKACADSRYRIGVSLSCTGALSPVRRTPSDEATHPLPVTYSFCALAERLD